MIAEIKRICEDIINRNTNPKFVDYNQIKVEIREELSRYLYQETEIHKLFNITSNNCIFFLLINH